MPSIGKGVFELKDGDERAWYRVIYLSVIDGVLYVLHCFEKDSRKTEKNDLALARLRLSAVQQRIQEQRKHEKRIKQAKPRS